MTFVPTHRYEYAIPQSDADYEEMQQWLRDHGGEWDCMRDGWNFLNEKEAILFRLRWIL